jgi:hypothetical protein
MSKKINSEQYPNFNCRGEVRLTPTINWILIYFSGSLRLTIYPSSEIETQFLTFKYLTVDKFDQGFSSDVGGQNKHQFLQEIIEL